MGDDEAGFLRDHRHQAVPADLELRDAVEPGQRVANHVLKGRVAPVAGDAAIYGEFVGFQYVFPALDHLVVGLAQRRLVLLHLRQQLGHLYDGTLDLGLYAVLVIRLKNAERGSVHSDGGGEPRKVKKYLFPCQPMSVALLFSGFVCMLLHWNNPTSWSMPSGFVHFGILRDQPIPVRNALPKA